MRTSILLAAMAVASMAISAGVSAEPPSATPATPPSASAPPTPSISPEFCNKSFQNVITNNTNIFVQLFNDEDAAGLTGDIRKAQTGMCMVYYQGMMDYVAATGPKT